MTFSTHCICKNCLREAHYVDGLLESMYVHKIKKRDGGKVEFCSSANRHCCWRFWNLCLPPKTELKREVLLKIFKVIFQYRITAKTHCLVKIQCSVAEQWGRRIFPPTHTMLRNDDGFLNSRSHCEKKSILYIGYCMNETSSLSDKDSAM